MSIRLSSFLKINILFFPILAASILGRYFCAFFAAFLCALLHEVSHVIAARCMGVGISYVEIMPFGVCARLKADIIKNPVREIIVALSGPLCNLAIACIMSVGGRYFLIDAKITEYFIICNLSMAAINLLPCLPLDGGRVLRSYLALKTGAIFAYNFCVKLSHVIVLLLIGGSVYLLLTNSFNFSLILIGAFLLGNLFLEQRNISRQTLKELLLFKDKLGCDKMSHASPLIAHKSTPARRILKKLSYNSYHIIFVVDDDLSILKTLSEGQLIDALTKGSIQITLDEI